jgi:hypothetical protein
MSLLLHVNGLSATRIEVYNIPTPDYTSTWQPVPHRGFIETILENADKAGLTIRSEAYGLANKGKRLFGVIAFEQGNEHGWSIGIRNSHDKSLRAGIVGGARIFVCDNLCFSGEFKAQRKHTPKIDINSMIGDAFKQLPEKIDNLFKNLERLKMEGLTEDEAKLAIFQAAEDRIVAPSEVLNIWHEFQKPTYSEFQEPTKFNLLMAFTEQAKNYSAGKLDKLHQKLPALLGY